jgi:hypothetical protein
MIGTVVSVTRFTPGGPAEKVRGLLGYLTMKVGGLRIDGITLRRDAAGGLRLSYPERIDSRGHRHPLVWPLDAATRAAIESAAFQALDLQADFGP